MIFGHNLRFNLKSCTKYAHFKDILAIENRLKYAKTAIFYNDFNKKQE